MLQNSFIMIFTSKKASNMYMHITLYLQHTLNNSYLWILEFYPYLNIWPCLFIVTLKINRNFQKLASATEPWPCHPHTQCCSWRQAVWRPTHAWPCEPCSSGRRRTSHGHWSAGPSGAAAFWPSRWSTRRFCRRLMYSCLCSYEIGFTIF